MVLRGGLADRKGMSRGWKLRGPAPAGPAGFRGTRLPHFPWCLLRVLRALREAPGAWGHAHLAGKAIVKEVIWNLRQGWVWEWHEGSRRSPGLLHSEEGPPPRGHRHLGLRQRFLRDGHASRGVSGGTGDFSRLPPHVETSPKAGERPTPLSHRTSAGQQGCVSISGPSNLWEDVHAPPHSQKSSLGKEETVGNRENICIFN